MDLYDLMCERNRRVCEIVKLPPAERIEALLALRAEVDRARSPGMVLSRQLTARELVRARRELRE